MKKYTVELFNPMKKDYAIWNTKKNQWIFTEHSGLPYPWLSRSKKKAQSVCKQLNEVHL